MDPASRRNQSVAIAQEAFDSCLESLQVTTDHLGIPMPTYAKVSGMFAPFVLHGIDRLLVRRGYENDVASLVQVTTDVAKERVEGDAWVLWSMHNEQVPSQIEACIFVGFISSSGDP
jgi:hypothetical protein